MRAGCVMQTPEFMNNRIPQYYVFEFQAVLWPEFYEYGACKRQVISMIALIDVQLAGMPFAQAFPREATEAKRSKRERARINFCFF